MIGHVAKPSPEEVQRVAKFEAVFNKVEVKLRQVLREPELSFHRLVQRFAERTPDNHIQERLDKFRFLRNELVHGKLDAERPLFIPTEEAVTELEAILRKLESPTYVPQNGPVECIRDRTDFAVAWRTMRGKNYSQLPAILDGRIVGLLTERALARWTTDRVVDGDFVDDITGCDIDDGLRLGIVQQDIHRVVTPDTWMDDVVGIFAGNSLDDELKRIQAVLVTEHGTDTTEILGILTAEDAIDHLNRKLA